jgi:hypothetical protein
MSKRDPMREICASCHETFGVHGASPPHTRGEECSGFVSSGRYQPKRAKRGVQP